MLSGGKGYLPIRYFTQMASRSSKSALKNRGPIAGVLVLLMLLYGFIQPVYAENKPEPLSQDKPISLSEALDIADKQNPQILVGRKAVAVAAAGIDIAKEIPNPQLFAQNNVGSFVALGAQNLIGINQKVELAGKRKKRTELAKSQYQLAIDQLNATRWSIREQTRQSYAAYISALALNEAIDNLERIAQDLVKIAQTRFDAGAAPMADVIQARLALSQTITQKNQALSQIKQARLALNTLLSQSLFNDETTGYTVNDYGMFTLTAQKTEILPLPDSPPLDINPLYERALKNRPDLIAAMQQVKANQAQITLLKAQRVPDPTVSPSYNYLKINSKDVPASQAGHTYLQGVGLQISVDVPIFHNMGPELKQAQAILEQSQLQVDATIKQLRNEIRTAYLAYELNRENVRVYQQKLIPDSKENLSLVQTGYQYGKYPLANVILAQQSYYQIIQSYLQAVSSLQTDWGNLEQAVGEPLPL